MAQTQQLTAAPPSLFSSSTPAPTPTPTPVPIDIRRVFEPNASIVLIGIRGTGKSTLAVMASGACRRRVVDVEALFHEATGFSTAKYRKQIERETELVKSGKLMRNRDDDLLPIESQVAKSRRPLGLTDFKLANRTGFALWTRTPLLEFETENKATETDYDDWKAEQQMQNGHTNGHTNGVQEVI